MKSIVRGAKALKVPQQDREDFASAIIKAEDNRRQARNINVMSNILIDKMQDKCVRFEDMVLTSEAVILKVKQMIINRDKK